MDIGIETNPDYRNRGLARILANQMVQYILSIGKSPIWECNVTNQGSKATAESVGFSVFETHPLFVKE